MLGPPVTMKVNRCEELWTFVTPTKQRLPGPEPLPAKAVRSIPVIVQVGGLRARRATVIAVKQLYRPPEPGLMSSQVVNHADGVSCNNLDVAIIADASDFHQLAIVRGAFLTKLLSQNTGRRSGRVHPKLMLPHARRRILAGDFKVAQVAVFRVHWHSSPRSWQLREPQLLAGLKLPQKLAFDASEQDKPPRRLGTRSFVTIRLKGLSIAFRCASAQRDCGYHSCNRSCSGNHHT